MTVIASRNPLKPSRLVSMCLGFCSMAFAWLSMLTDSLKLSSIMAMGNSSDVTLMSSMRSRRSAMVM